MKLIFFIIVFFTSNAVFSNCLNSQPLRNYFEEDTSRTFISKLEVGETISYKIFLTSCLTGNRLESMDSISFSRDSTAIIANYKGIVYTIKNNDFDKLKKLEYNLLSIGSTNKTTYYNYIVSFNGKEGLIGFGDKLPWDELINFLTIK